MNGIAFFRGAADPRGHGARRLVGRRLSRGCQLRSCENVLAAGPIAVVLGALEAGFSSDDRLGRPAGEVVGGTLARGHLQIVRALGRLSRRKNIACGVGASDGSGAVQGRAFAATWNANRTAWRARHMPGVVQTSPMVVGVLASRGSCTDEQRQRTMPPSVRFAMR